MHKHISDDTFTIKHDRNTRNRNHAVPTFHRLTKSQHAVSYKGPTLWNRLPTFLKDITNLKHFKKDLKTYLLQAYTDQQI